MGGTADNADIVVPGKLNDLFVIGDILGRLSGIAKTGQTVGSDTGGIIFYYGDNSRHGLARILHEGNEAQGKSGGQSWTIARRCIAIATHQGGSFKIGRQIFPDFVQAQNAKNYKHVKFPSTLFWSIPYMVSCAAFVQYTG
jgi:hypothetical protein